MIAVQWVFRGTNTGTLPDGTPATGRAVILPGASFIRLDFPFKIRSEQIYFDRLKLFDLLGLKPK